MTDVEAGLILKDLRNSESKIILYLGSSFTDFERLFRVAKAESMAGSGYAWITTDSINSTVLSSPEYEGVISMQPSSFNSSVTQEFDFYWRDHRFNVGSPTAATASVYISGKLFSNQTYYTASCVDHIAYGLDKVLKNSTGPARSVAALINGNTD